MYTVDADAGRRMTDGLVSGNGAVLAVIAEATPDDVIVAFIDILEAARDQLGFAAGRSQARRQPWMVIVRSTMPGVFAAGADIAELRDRDADAALLAINAGLFDGATPAVARGGAGRRGRR